MAQDGVNGVAQLAQLAGKRENGKRNRSEIDVYRSFARIKQKIRSARVSIKVVEINKVKLSGES